MNTAEKRTRVELINSNPPLLRAVRFEEIFGRPLRRSLLEALFFIVLVAGIIFSVLAAAVSVVSFSPAISTTLTLLYQLVAGVFLVAFGPFWFLLVAEFYFLTTSRPEPLFRSQLAEGERVFSVNLGALRRLWLVGAFERDEIDISTLYRLFPASIFIREFFLRLGVAEDIWRSYARRQAERSLVIPRSLLFETLVYEAHEAFTDTITAREFVLLLYDMDKEFEQFLFEREVHKEDVVQTAGWVTALENMKKSRLRWWERPVLDHIPGFGANFLFGYTYLLDKYSHDILPGVQGAVIPGGSLHANEIREVAGILARSAQTNALLVGDPGSGKMSVLEELARLIMEGSAPSALWQKRLVTLDSSAVTAETKTKGDFEELVIKIMNEAVRAGNIVLVIERFPEFLESASHIGVNAVSLLEPYLEGSSLQVVAFSDTEAYHRILEQNGIIIKLFEKIEITTPSEEMLLPVLEEAAYHLEKRSTTLFTHQALQAADELADRYITEGAMPEKAIDLLELAMSSARAAGERMVTKQHVESAVEQRTKIPVGKAGEEEATRLLRLEEILHERVVGQDAAVRAVAGALRRARSGLHASKRPIGSFLFLGPTGVGKTETAKALADVYFGSEDAMARFDMSEYQGPEGVSKLIGSFQMREPGILANALRARPFSLLLFDEFEKSSTDVVNLFLQILEEGFFTDAGGHRVWARDAIIIATSNAGSNFIWEYVSQGKNPASLQAEVVEEIRKEGVFAPEILNRFDELVVYEPLTKEKLYSVARLLLNELAKNLKAQDIEFIITEELISKIVEIGYNPVMGARPMRRAIADRVEQVIAKKILEGSLGRGQTFQFSTEEIAQL